jgi:hypothetical protein
VSLTVFGDYEFEFTRIHQQRMDEIFIKLAKFGTLSAISPEAGGQRSATTTIQYDDLLLDLEINGYVLMKPFTDWLHKVYLTDKGMDSISDTLYMNNIHRFKQVKAEKKQAMQSKHHRRDTFFEGWKLTRNGGKVMCTSCFAINVRCSCANAEFINIHRNARAPSKTAGKRKWFLFLQKFAPSVLQNKNWWKERNSKL